MIVPCGRLVVVMVSGGLVTVMLRLAVVLAGVGVWESVTLTVKLVVPTAVGIPEITPVEGFRVRPAGRLPTILHV